MTYRLSGVLAVLWFAVFTSQAQNSLANTGSDNLRLEAQNSGVSGSSFMGASDGSLLGPAHTTDSSLGWTLFLADLDSGQKIAPNQRSMQITATPEPSTYALLGLAALLLIHYCSRRKAH